MIQIGLMGSSGRMGKWVSQLIRNEFSPQASLGVQINSQTPLDDVLNPLLAADVIIDFSNPKAFQKLIPLALKKSGPLPAFVIGSTGWKAEEFRGIEELASRTSVLVASNFSGGVFAVSEILKRFSPLLKKIGYTPVLVEAHHKHKKDAPSGTALFLQKAISPENPKEVQTHSIRAGEVIGDHEVTFYSAYEQIKIAHSAQDRSIWARGAIQVALWLMEKRKAQKYPPQLLSIEDYFTSLMADSQLQQE